MLALSRLKQATKVLSQIKSVKYEAVSKSGMFTYRQAQDHNKMSTRDKTIVFTILAGATYYLLYRFYDAPDHLLGHFPYPDPSKWTDEELGIPPDEEGLAPLMEYPKPVPVVTEALYKPVVL